MQKIYIGIDPDVEKSGVAIWYKQQKKLELYNKTFFRLFDLLKFLQSQNFDIFMVIEAGWLNKSNWHAIKDKSHGFNSKIGERVGANFETGKKIVEMAKYLDIKHSLIKPKSKKTDSETFNKITGYKLRTNQEQRDAAMLVFGM